ncbi:hypothetical protein SAMN05660461_6406 [Chitinophaga ginsengisegetis]|uniref:Uncharacterized protein n=1 Tax=Chitinophaga ginsengisegetis TaxID=393003 RepID=A0A1T5PD30_9BACT|nr:hypothetical protein [Chitinophaga ginsengisegetis]SKD10488.1 hypothetical protein SAMN05660461_6406 [Chitinophaga ginsengisegetis]
MKNILIIAVLVLSIQYSNAQQRVRFVPDTAVNSIHLNDYSTTEKVLGKNIWNKQFEQAKSLPRIELVNKSKTQALRLFFHYGGSKNAVDEFEILCIDSTYKMPKQTVLISDELFVTSRKIRLGITREEIVKILGDNYKTATAGDTEGLAYVLDQKSGFVKRYNQYRYYIKCTLNKGVLVKYAFGFESE